MKVPLSITCAACGEEFQHEVIGTDLPDYFECPKCGAQPYNIRPLGNIATKLLIERARLELANGDMSLSILLSAIAVEAEMAYLFSKWKGIDSGRVLGNQTPEDRKRWEDEWTNMRSIGKRLDELSRLLTTKPFEEFARLKMDLLKPALTGYDPATSFKDFFQKQFFDKRNDIAHYGRIDINTENGTRSFLLATGLLNLLHAMDVKRYDLTFSKK